MSGPLKLTPLRRALLVMAWVLVLALAAIAVQRTLRISADLRLFMPPPVDVQERLLMDGIASGPASRLVLVGIEGAEVPVLADASASLAETLRETPGVVQVLNGDGTEHLDIPEALVPLRFLLADEDLDASALADALQARREDLASPLAPLVEEWLPRDPGLLALGLVDAWVPGQLPEQREGVWFSHDGSRAVLVVELALSGFDPDAQSVGMTALEGARARVAPRFGVQVHFSGPAAFSADIRRHTEAEASLIGTVDSVALLVLLLLAYRRLPWVLLGALPLASAGLAGLVAVGLLFGEAHGITLAFGFTLIGVAQDYPLHLFSHLHPGADPHRVARHIWPTLATGVASTCVAYLAFVMSGVTGLAQLGCFTISGLAAAAIATRWLLPPLLSSAGPDPAHSPALCRLQSRIDALPRLRPWMLITLGAAALLASRFSPSPLWENDLGRLTPVPPALLARDRALREDLRTPDVRYLLAVEGASAEQALQASEALMPALATWQEQGLVADFDLAARYLPSVARQRARQAALPAPGVLSDAISSAADTRGFEPTAFAPFLADVERARAADPLRPTDLAGTPLQTRVDSLLLERAGRWTALVTLTGVADATRLDEAARAARVTLLDLKRAADTLVERQRGHILQLLGISAVLLIVIVWLALRQARRVWRAVAPMALTTLLVVAILQLSGISLSLFHLVSLVLAAGLGLDYAMFFERPLADRDEQVRTLHGVLACSVTTMLVFFLLALSSLPVLRSIGTTVALGAALNFLFALLISRPDMHVERA